MGGGATRRVGVLRREALKDFSLGGLEYRFTPHVGIFTEAGYDVIDGPQNNAVQINWGARFAF